MKHKTMIPIASAVFLVCGGALYLPKLLQSIGLHPDYKREEYDFNGKKALIVTTSQSTLGEGGKETGVYASEMTVPYYEFSDAKMKVDIASIKGGQVPIEKMSLKYPLATQQDKRFLKDDSLQKKVEHSLKIDDLDFTEYDLIFMAGGWGAAYDLGTNKVLGDQLTKANADGKILGSVCHGALGFLQAYETDGEHLVKGKKMTGVTDKQIKELNAMKTPLHPETELRKQGADFRSKKKWKDIFATLTVLDGNIVTGQNQNSGMETAQTMMKLLKETIWESSNDRF